MIAAASYFARPVAAMAVEAVYVASEQIVAMANDYCPQVVVGTALIATAVAGWGWWNRGASVEKELQQLVTKTHATLKRAEAAKDIEAFVEKNWTRLGLPEAAKNDHNKKVLVRRLGTIMLGSCCAELKLEKCKNVCKNFTTFLNASCQRIVKDLQEDRKFQTMFGLLSTDTIASVKLLGEETHNRGQVPLMVEFTSGKKVIYKPRSMITEELICGSEESLFKRAGLQESTYHVHHKGTYGYAEYLENNERENTCDSAAEVQAYLAKFAPLDAFARALGVSDLHCENVITRRKTPLLIDTEVMCPLDTQDFVTNLIHDTSAGYAFGFYTKNRIWFSPALKATMEFSIIDILERPCANGEDAIVAFNELGVLTPTVVAYRRTPPTLSAAHTTLATQTRTALSRHNHRIVLIDTTTLTHLNIASLNTSPDRFLEALERGATHHACTFDNSKIRAIKERFIQDVSNNDIPLFYYNSARGELYYHDIVIANKS